MAPAVNSVWATLCCLARGTGLLPAAGLEDDRDAANNCGSSASLMPAVLCLGLCLHRSLPCLTAPFHPSAGSQCDGGKGFSFLLFQLIWMGFLTRQPIVVSETPFLIDFRAMCESQVLWRDAGAPGAAHQEPAAAETV